MSGSLPTRIPRKPIRRLILIQPLYVGDKGVAKIKWRHDLGTEAFGVSPRRVDAYCYDST